MGSYSNASGTCAYEVHTPPRRDGSLRPLVMMLHGCMQDPADFAAGTRMNALADRHDFVVVYPAQSRAKNALGCWNWFSPSEQQRDFGEPSLLAGIARETAARHAVDVRKIFVAGLSAGGAMAVILGETHPDLFAAVGCHSAPPPPLHPRPGSSPLPRIVFHGDADATVDIQGGAEIVRRAVAREESGGGPLHEVIDAAVAAGGRSCTVTRYLRDTALPMVEYWVVHGAGHAWSGGSPDGSFTDERGPDASAEMVRFFLSR